MRYKTLFRVLLKLVGVWVFVQGVVTLLQFAAWLMEPGAFAAAWFLVVVGPGVLQVGIGLYLFFGGKWIADHAIPGNRPYCPECGYDLSRNRPPQCPECGTALPPVAPAEEG